MFVTQPPQLISVSGNAKTIPGTAGGGAITTNLFTVTGQVILRALTVVCTTSITGNASCALSMGPSFTPTPAGLSAIVIANPHNGITPNTTPILVGAMGGIGTSVVSGNATVNFLLTPGFGNAPAGFGFQDYVFGPGTITMITAVTTANVTAGAVRWDCAYNAYAGGGNITAL